jgi:chromosome segregation ATPase
MGEESKQILAKMESMESKLTQMDEKMTQMEKNLKGEIKELRSEIKAVETRLSGEIGQVKTAVMEISDDVEAILDMYADQQLKINKLANKIKAG